MSIEKGIETEPYFGPNKTDNKGFDMITLKAIAGMHINATRSVIFNSHFANEILESCNLENSGRTTGITVFEKAVIGTIANVRATEYSPNCSMLSNRPIIKISN